MKGIGTVDVLDVQLLDKLSGYLYVKTFILTRLNEFNENSKLELWNLMR